MTVDELLAKLAMAFPAFNAAAVEAWAPVFRARFGHREGPKLQDAYEQTLGEFSVKKSKSLFPVPADFEVHLPNLRNIKDAKDGPISHLLEARHSRAHRLFEEWHRTQGLKIKAARPKFVYGACMLEVYARAKRADDHTSDIRLTSEDIATCAQTAVTCERLHRFGSMPKSADAWHAQCAEIRAEWAPK